MAKRIEHIITLGDSLSDRGTMDKRMLLGIIPMDELSGLKARSPDGRFTNGYVWDDFLSYHLIQKWNKRRPVNLKDNTQVTYKKEDFMRNYNEGGMTSHNYFMRKTNDIKLFFTQKILSHLSEKRSLLLEDDKARLITPAHKNKSLIVEWSGANDLVTVNTEPTYLEAARAVLARINNVEQLIKTGGYSQFVLCNLPDLGSTPRFKARSEEEQQNATEVTNYFNQFLQEQVDVLKKKYGTQIDIHIFNVHNVFKEVYTNPVQYGFDEDKLTTAYTTSKDFKLAPQRSIEEEIKRVKNRQSSASGYLFWDDLHPSEALHMKLAEEFSNFTESLYDFEPPNENLIEIFKEAYGQRFLDEKRKLGCLSFFCQSRIAYKDPNLSLERVLRHALYEGGYRTREVIINLGWINAAGEILLTNNAQLMETMTNIANPEVNISEQQSLLASA